MSTIQIRKQLPAAFYEHLDACVEFAKGLKNSYIKAIGIAEEYGLSREEAKLVASDYLKDKVPRSTLWNWNNPKPLVPNEADSTEKSSSRVIDVTKRAEHDPIYKPEPYAVISAPIDKFESASQAAEYYFRKSNEIQTGVKIQDAIDEIMNSRRDGVLTGSFYWKGDTPK